MSDLDRLALMKKLAALELAGVSRAQAAKELGIGIQVARTLQSKQEYKDLLSVANDEKAAEELSLVKTRLAKLATKAILAVEKALDEGAHREALQAANVVFKAVGIDTPEKNDGAGAPINIILPNVYQDNQVIEVVSEDK